jgi:aminopeptidase-like protein
LPEKPDWIPYRTAYFREQWGFCLPHRQRLELAARGPAERYAVVIDAVHRPGSLSYGECFLPGTSGEEILLHTHVCHPSLANDNLSGIVVAVALARHLAALPQRRYGYRFVFAPATIGALAWLSRNRESLGRIRHGLVLAQLGDAAPLTYKRSQQHQATIDWAMTRTLRERGQPHRVIDFQPWGYDERQFCSPGFDLPVGRLTRSADGEYPQYHTSADNLALLQPESLADSLACLVETLASLEDDRTYRNTLPYGEAELGRRGLHSSFGQSGYGGDSQRAIQWLLNQSNGRRGLLEIAERSSLNLNLLRHTAASLCEQNILKCVSPKE